MKEILLKLASPVKANGGKLFLVGGAVRDMVLNLPIKDYDCECYNLTEEELLKLLDNFAKDNECTVSLVGESFKVFKLRDLTGFELDVALPRTEKSIGRKHTDFEVIANPYLDYRISSRRRDFRLNSMLYNPLTEEIIDIYGGQEDIKDKIIRVVDQETFVEDSLRVLRAMQFAARFNFTVHPETVELCRSIDLSDLPAERLWGEIEKWLLSANPSVGLKYFFELGIYKLFPLDEGILSDVELTERIIKSVGSAMDYGVKEYLCNRQEKLAVQLLLLSNFFWNVADFEKFLNILGLYTWEGYNVRKKVIDILMNADETPSSYSEIRKASTKYDVGLYCVFKMQEASTNIKQEQYFCNLESTYNNAKKLNCLHSPLPALLLGRHVLELGVAQGKRIGEICKYVYEAQLDGRVSTVEEAIAEAKKYL